MEKLNNRHNRMEDGEGIGTCKHDDEKGRTREKRTTEQDRTGTGTGVCGPKPNAAQWAAAGARLVGRVVVEHRNENITSHPQSRDGPRRTREDLRSNS